MIKAILWDNDGVLVNTERLFLRATQQILAQAGIELTEQQFIQFSLKEGKGAWHLATERGIPFSETERMREERNRLYSRLLQQEPLVVDGAQETLARLYGRFRMGIVTSSRSDHFEIIHRSTNLLQYIDFVLTGEDYTRYKPDPEPYLLGIARAGVEKDECIAVEDSERGLAAARSAGLECLVIPTEMTRGGDFSAATMVLNHISEVAAVLLQGEGPG